jgi:hypothetical protein
MNKKGYFFIMDAMMGVVIMVSSMVYFYSIHAYDQPKNQIYFLTDNMMNFLSGSRLATINNGYKDSLVLSGNITNLDNTVLEQVNEFEYRNKSGCSYCNAFATNLIANLTDGIVERQYNYRVSLNNRIVYEKSSFPESFSLLTLKSGRIIYTFLNGTDIYGPSYAEVMFWQ